MNLRETLVSVIIPTHNRSASVIRLLDNLRAQTYDASFMEVIVVANSCTDDTLSVLKNYSAPFRLKIAESQGNGPAVPRNKGASIAAGSLLIFLDDDIEPSNGLVAAHVNAAKSDEHTVVVGYLPLKLESKAGLYRIALRTWWEDKFAQMESPGYRFNYSDLLSGNFSISATLFKKANGFVTGFTCRDDYELGIRLIELGASIVFSREAWGYHNDVVTDLDRSLKRKVEEGKMDVRLAQLHPQVPTPVQEAHAKTKRTFLSKRLGKLLMLSPSLSDLYAVYLRKYMDFSEKMKLHRTWKILSNQLHNYWYYKGVLACFPDKKEMESYLHKPVAKRQHEDLLQVDISQGLAAAEKLIDDVRPAGLVVKHGDETIGIVLEREGYEPLKGSHLRRILANDLAWDLMKVLALENLSNSAANEPMPSSRVNGEKVASYRVIKQVHPHKNSAVNI
jgi:GT2 family glycosyltransferase